MVNPGNSRNNWLLCKGKVPELSIMAIRAFGGYSAIPDNYGINRLPGRGKMPELVESGILAILVILVISVIPG